MATTIIGQYKIFNYCVLGRGVSSEVKLAEDTISGHRCAVKIINKSKLTASGAKNLVTELKALRMLRHPNIAEVYCTIEQNNNIYIFMEYLANGTLYKCIANRGRISEKEAKDVLNQLLDAIEYCHLNNVYHRDLKLENLVFDANNTLKVIDFGLCAVTEFPGTLLTQYCGTHLYAAPQIHAGQPYEGGAADVWSMGVILFSVLCGYMPFYVENNNVKELSSRVRNSPPLAMVNDISLQAVDLVSRMLTKDPHQRITLSEIRKHPWLSGQSNEIAFPVACSQLSAVMTATQVMQPVN